MRRCSVNGRVSDTQPDNVLTVRISPDYPDVSEVARERYRGIHATPSAHGIPATVAITLERTTSMSATYIYNSPAFGIVANSATKRPERPSASWHAEHYAAGPFERTKGIKTRSALASQCTAYTRNCLPVHQRPGIEAISLVAPLPFRKKQRIGPPNTKQPILIRLTRPLSIAQRFSTGRQSPSP